LVVAEAAAPDGVELTCGGFVEGGGLASNALGTAGGAAAASFGSLRATFVALAGTPFDRGWNVLDAEILVCAVEVAALVVDEACKPRKPLILSPMPQALEGDAFEAGTPDCCTVREFDWIFDFEGDAALAAARRALAFVGEVAPDLPIALAATFLGESEEVLAVPDSFVDAAGAGTTAAASLFAASSDVPALAFELALLRVTAGAEAGTVSAGSGVFSLE